MFFNRPLLLTQILAYSSLVLLILGVVVNIIFLFYFTGKHNNVAFKITLFVYAFVNLILVYPAFLFYNTLIAGILP